MKDYQKVRRYRCNICGELFKNRKNAKKHSQIPIEGIILPRGLVFKERCKVFYSDFSHKEHWGIIIVIIPSYLSRGIHNYCHEERLVYASTGEKCPKKGAIDILCSSSRFLSRLKRNEISFLSGNDFEYFKRYFERHPELHFEYFNKESEIFDQMNKDGLIRKIDI